MPQGQKQTITLEEIMKCYEEAEKRYMKFKQAKGRTEKEALADGLPVHKVAGKEDFRMQELLKLMCKKTGVDYGKIPYFFKQTKVRVLDANALTTSEEDLSNLAEFIHVLRSHDIFQKIQYSHQSLKDLLNSTLTHPDKSEYIGISIALFALFGVITTAMAITVLPQLSIVTGLMAAGVASGAITGTEFLKMHSKVSQNITDMTKAVDSMMANLDTIAHNIPEVSTNQEKKELLEGRVEMNKVLHQVAAETQSQINDSKREVLTNYDPQKKSNPVNKEEQAKLKAAAEKAITDAKNISNAMDALSTTTPAVTEKDKDKKKTRVKSSDKKITIEEIMNCYREGVQKYNTNRSTPKNIDNLIMQELLKLMCEKTGMNYEKIPYYYQQEFNYSSKTIHRPTTQGNLPEALQKSSQIWRDWSTKMRSKGELEDFDYRSWGLRDEVKKLSLHLSIHTDKAEYIGVSIALFALFGAITTAMAITVLPQLSIVTGLMAAGVASGAITGVSFLKMHSKVSTDINNMKTTVSLMMEQLINIVREIPEFENGYTPEVTKELVHKFDQVAAETQSQINDSKREVLTNYDPQKEPKKVNKEEQEKLTATAEKAITDAEDISNVINNLDDIISTITKEIRQERRAAIEIS